MILNRLQIVGRPFVTHIWLPEKTKNQPSREPPKVLIRLYFVYPTPSFP